MPSHYERIIFRRRTARKHWTRSDILSLKEKLSPGIIFERPETYLSSLCIVLTEKCNVQCRHCIAECSPMAKGELPWIVVKRILIEARSIGTIKEICFTGGEPFLDLDKISLIVALCKSLDLKATVLTNGYWASDMPKARRVLNRLSGLTSLAISTDAFHQEFIPVLCINSAIRACNELGIACSVGISYLDNPLEEISRVRKQLQTVSGLYTLFAQPVVRYGRAAKQITENRFFSYDPTIAFCRNADTHNINSDGIVYACCGPSASWTGYHPLRLGNIYEHSLQDIFKAADSNFILHALRLWGMRGLLQLTQAQAEKEGAPFFLPHMFEVCALCEYLLANSERTELLRRSVQDSDIRRQIAVERLIKRGEVSMLLGLEEKGGPLAFEHDDGC